MSELLYQTLRESVVNAIRTKIMNHQIRPGERRDCRVYQKCGMFRADIFFLGFL